MPDELKFNKIAYDAGQAMFLRGITLDLLIDQINRDTKEPECAATQWEPSDEKLQADQEAREQVGIGLMLGYLNGIAQAVRRIDNQLMQSNQ